jgi:hypothetical protein
LITTFLTTIEKQGETCLAHIEMQGFETIRFQAGMTAAAFPGAGISSPHLTGNCLLNEVV